MPQRNGPPVVSDSWRPVRGLLMVPLILLVIVAVSDILSPADVHLGPLTVVAPAITASFAGPRLTGAIGVVSVATLVAIGAARGVLASENLEVQIGSLTIISAFITAFAYVRARRERELAQVRAVSDAAQHVLLRPLPAHLGSLRTATMYRASAAQASVGGDLYAVSRIRDGTRIIIGDVRGKGLASLADAALLLGAFRSAAHRNAPLPLLAAQLEDSVRWGLVELAQSDQPYDEAQDPAERFVTAALLDILEDEPVLRLVNCGHLPPLLLRQGRVTALAGHPAAPPLGLGTLAATWYRTDTFLFQTGDLLLLHTDGITEARDPDGRFYPLAERLAQVNETDPDLLVRKITEDLMAHTGGLLDDDAAMIAIRREESGP
jgi:serine phosphatase RsbU (regulator of sigma subunit)